MHCQIVREGFFSISKDLQRCIDYIDMLKFEGAGLNDLLLTCILLANGSFNTPLNVHLLDEITEVLRR